jgi:hypothetical protein
VKFMQVTVTERIQAQSPREHMHRGSGPGGLEIKLLKASRWAELEGTTWPQWIRKPAQSS